MTRAGFFVRLVLVGIWFSIGGCASEIGDHCGVDGDCPSVCRTGGGFPDGICTQACDASADCPDGWICISDSGGICMLPCATPAECSDRFGAPWTCRSKSLQESGDALVCFGP